MPIIVRFDFSREIGEGGGKGGEEMERLRKKPSEIGTKLGAVLTGVVQSSMPFHSSIDGWMGVRMRACVARLKTFDKFDTFQR